MSNKRILIRADFNFIYMAVTNFNYSFLNYDLNTIGTSLQLECTYVSSSLVSKRYGTECLYFGNFGVLK